LTSEQKENFPSRHGGGNLRRESDIHHEAGLAGCLGEVHRLSASRHGVLEASVRQLAEFAGFGLCSVCGISDEHAEAGLEGCYFAPAIYSRRVVNRLTAGSAFEPDIAFLGNSMEAPVLCAEEEDGGPVVGEVLRECASRARCSRGNVVNIGVHGGIESIPTDYLVKVGTEYLAREHEAERR
jgi:hypothetical protein